MLININILNTMILIILLVTHSLLAVVGTHSDAEFCDIDAKSCGKDIAKNSEEKLIFYDVNPGEGFNLNRDVYMRFAIMLAEAQKKDKSNWKLVLPPWYNFYHWKYDRGIPLPWNKFFEIDLLKSFSPVMELHEVFTKTESNVLEIDTLYVLKNYEDAFEGGTFKEKWQIVENCDKNVQFWGYENITAKEILCVQFQGKVSKLWEVISVHRDDRKVMFSHGEIPLHDNYGTKIFWDCRKSMKFNKNLFKVAKKYISMNLNCNATRCKNYLSVHWRRQDFARSRGNDVPTIAGTAKQILKTLKKFPEIDKIFIATDAAMSELSALKKELASSKYEIHLFLPDAKLIEKHGDGGIAIIDQIICSRAAYFIGTHESTFSFRIEEEREILGFPTETTFNRLCPDTGHCEKPSVWKMVNGDK